MSLALGRKVSKVSIMPYSSGIGGMTVEDTDDKEDKRMKTKTELQNDIKVLLAGREAEKIMMGDTSIGCSNDIERASVIAFNIVNSFAMTDDKLVNVMALAEVGINLFDTKGIISDMNDILKVCNDDVNKVLTEHKDKLKKLSDILLRDETIIDVDFAILEENN
jgi:cell division protease FtsH